MKKMLAILLLATLAISICACGSNGIKLNEDGYLDTIIIEDNNNSYEESDNNIELTTSNIEDYLQIELSDANWDWHQDFYRNYYSCSDLIVRTYPITSGTFENVNITLELTAPDTWLFCDTEYKAHNIDTYPQSKEINIVLNKNGETTYSYVIVNSNASKVVPSTYSYQITSVSGTLVKD